MKAYRSNYFIISLLLSQEREIFLPLAPEGYTFLYKENDKYLRAAVREVVDNRVQISTTLKGRLIGLDRVDTLFAVHYESFTVWRFPTKDLPEKQKLYLSKRFDNFLMPLWSPAKRDLRNPTFLSLVQKERNKMEIADKKKILKNSLEADKDIEKMFGETDASKL